MNVYIFILILIFCAYISLPETEKGKKQLISIACFLFIIQSGCRHYSVGTDTESYYNSFYQVMRTPWSDIISDLFRSRSETRDPGYGILLKSFSSIIPSWQAYLFASALFLYYSLGRLWNRYLSSKRAVLFAATLWLALFNIIALSGMRQMFTTSVAFLITPLIERKQWKIVLPAVLASSLVHVSMLFLLPLIPLSYFGKHMYNKMLLVSIALVPVIGAMSQSIMAWMVSNMENEYYKGYAEVAEGAKAYTYVILCTGLSIFILVYNKLLSDAPKFYMISAVMMTALVPLILRGGTAIRIGQYYTVYMMLSLPYIMDRLPSKRDFYYQSMIAVLVYYIIISSISFATPFFWDDLQSYYLGL